MAGAFAAVMILGAAALLPTIVDAYTECFLLEMLFCFTCL